MIAQYNGLMCSSQGWGIPSLSLSLSSEKCHLPFMDRFVVVMVVTNQFLKAANSTSRSPRRQELTFILVTLAG